MIRDAVAQMLLKLGIILMLAGFFPPAAQIYDWLTCNEADAVVQSVAPGGNVKVAFHDAAGRPVTALAARYHLQRGEHAFASSLSRADAPDLAALAEAARLRNGPAAEVGQTVRVIYRSANPTSLAPHRSSYDTLIGLGAMALGAAMLFAARAVRAGAAPAGASGQGKPLHRGTAPSTATPPIEKQIPRPARPLGSSKPPSLPVRPVRVGVVQRNRGWFG